MTFRDKVYECAKKIPKGKVVTYKQLAGLAGNHNASRAVGMFMKTNPSSPVVPCHRVVASDGSLRGFSMEGGVVKKKQWLLEEGVSFRGEKVDLSKSQWQVGH